jgi:hypothetical protein
MGAAAARKIVKAEEAERAAERERWWAQEQARIKRQREAFDDLPEGPIRDHLRDMMLQRAYDILCEGNGEGCDELLQFLPEDHARELLDAWLDDQISDVPKSKWY